LVQVDQARQWWLGDWWNACQWGDGKEACEHIGVDYTTAADCGAVARMFEFARRRVKLTFSHHAEVCPIDDPSMQDKLLDWCLDGERRRTVKELRQKVQAYLAMKDWGESEKSRRFDVESGGSDGKVDHYMWREPILSHNTRSRLIPGLGGLGGKGRLG
jgi:hypothetical protein